MSQLNLKKQTTATTTTPPTGYLGLYYDTSTSQFKYLDDTGAVFTFNSTVTTVSVVSANGLAGSVANAGTTPAITLTTTITGVLKGNGTAISAATPGSDYSAGTAGLVTGILKTTTTTGALTIAVAGDFPILNQNTTGNAVTATTASTVTTNANLTGPVTSTGNATAVTANAITNTMLAQMPTQTIKGNNTGGTANAIDLTQTQVTAFLNPATTSLQGAMSPTDKTRSNNWYNSAVYNVLDNGISPSNSGAVNVTAWNALMTVLANSTATIYFPPGVYDIASVCNIPAGVHVRVMGAGTTTRTSESFGTIIRTTSATADMFTCSDWYDQFTDLTFRSSVTRSAGAVINSGNNVGIEVINCNFNTQFNGIVFSGGASAGNLGYVTNCHFTDTVNFSIQIDGANCNAIITACTADCAPASVAHLEINQCGSLLVDNCDFIRATNNMRLNPDSGTKGVFSVYCTNTFFDTAAGSSVKYQGSGTTNIQRSKYVNCWFSGSVNGIEFAGTQTNLPTAIDFVNCDIYSNSGNGILATAVQDFSLSNCRLAGNTTAGINTVAATGAVTRFNIQNNRVGPTAGVGANGIGINVQAGTYGAYTMTGNDVAGNTSNNNILDAGSVATTDLKQVADNLGRLISGAIATLATPLSVPITTETLVLAARIPANAVLVGQVFRIRTIGVQSGLNTVTYRCRIGANGTVADAQAWIAVVSTAGAANCRHGCEIYVTVRSTGGAGTAEAEGTQFQSTASVVSQTSTVAGVAATTTAVTNAAWFISVTLAQGVGTSLMQQAVIETL